MGRDVIIKVISKGEEGVQELQILKLLNSAPLRLDPANATVPVLEFLAYGDWTFAVMPRWGSCTFPPLKDAAECLEFADQVVSVSGSALLAILSINFSCRACPFCTKISLHIWFKILFCSFEVHLICSISRTSSVTISYSVVMERCPHCSTALEGPYLLSPSSDLRFP
jgi:hypothetical protein